MKLYEVLVMIDSTRLELPLIVQPNGDIPCEPQSVFKVGNVIMYTSCYKDNNGVEDLKQARLYLDLAIKELIWREEND